MFQMRQAVARLSLYFMLYIRQEKGIRHTDAGKEREAVKTIDSDHRLITTSCLVSSLSLKSQTGGLMMAHKPVISDNTLLREAKMINKGKIPKHVVYTKTSENRKRQIYVFNDTGSCVDFCYRLGNRPYRLITR